MYRNSNGNRPPRTIPAGISATTTAGQGPSQAAMNGLGRTIETRRQAQALAGQEEAAVLGGRGDVDMRRFLSPALASFALVQVGTANGTAYGALAVSSNRRYWLPWTDLQSPPPVPPAVDPVPAKSVARIRKANKAHGGDPKDTGERVVTVQSSGGAFGAFSQRYMEDGDVW